MNVSRLGAAALLRRVSTTSSRHHQLRLLSSGRKLDYTAPIDEHSSRTGRIFGPDKIISPLSRKPIPEKIRTRNEAGPYEAPGNALPIYPKRKNARKRTTALIDALTAEEALRMIKDGRATFAEKLPRPLPGQVLRITYSCSNNEGDSEADSYFTGIVIAARQRLLGSSVILRNVVSGIAIERCFALYSPLVKDVEIIGQKRVVRNKLYYLRDRKLRESTFANPTSKPGIFVQNKYRK